ncbi:MULTISPECIES: type IV toxin-antitoxin system AbiEi family antitoxin domain-containing protein [Acinetobacter]|uniref:type IV toxin-antitoxin system AbiEi family antitoxin domain-containing protein n=1 Tax=Acinetobacter TaxID=469 RepID=UPI0004D47C7C|nr:MULTISPECIES: hypothetical protein [unclassified Acinetobacter]KEC82733.1 hypothetical protein DT74_21215 [Acinetobacter sp. ETR1]WEE38396.1 hypothetical protein PYV58_15795 [Acinetobacter sp. TAC-1]
MQDLKLSEFKNIPIHHGTLLSLLKEYQNPNDKISRWIKAGTLIPLQRGLYLVGDLWRNSTPCLPLIANHLYGPSCVSLDYALSWHGIIPEKVVEITSVTTKRSLSIENTLGRFSYHTIAQSIYPIGIQSQSFENGYFLLASPEKALCDKLLTIRNLRMTSQRSMQIFLEEDLRIDMDMLVDFDFTIINAYIAAGIKTHLFKVLKGLLKEIA